MPTDLAPSAVAVDAPVDALLSRLADTEGVRRLGELLDQHPHTEGLVSRIRHIRQRELEAILASVAKLLDGSDE